MTCVGMLYFAQAPSVRLGVEKLTACRDCPIVGKMNKDDIKFCSDSVQPPQSVFHRKEETGLGIALAGS